ncbi:MAG: O-antigen ligase family protein [Saprospiraceae bacterium]|jgi:O-antigen ligase|nr:O-antigen ligase family protein [Saprospiraceae bacterium]
MYRSKAMLNKIILLLTLRILSYFTLFPDSVLLTQAMKTGLRLLLTFTAFFILKSLRDKHRSHAFAYGNFTPFAMYGGYLLLGLLSVAWASLPNYAMLQWAMIAEALTFAWFFTQLLTYYNAISDHHARLSLVFGRAALFIGIGFVAGWYLDPATFARMTHEGEVARLGGIIINPNELGMLAVLGTVMAYAELLDKRSLKINLLLIGVSVAVLLLTQSRSSLISFLLVSFIFIVKLKNIRVISLSVVGAAVALPFLFYSIILKQGDMEEVMSMTGRLPFWRDLLTDGFTKRPLFGFGFMCVADGEYFHSIHSYSAKMTHNTFVQVLLNLGLVGFFLCFIQMIATLFAIGNSPDERHRGLAWMMLIPLLINSFTEFGIFGESNYGIQFYQLLFLLFVIKTVPVTSLEPVRHYRSKPALA